MQLIHGDCLVEMDKLISQGVKVDAVITDIPYGITTCKWDNVIPFDEMWSRLNKLIKPNGAIVLFGSEPFSSHLRLSNIKNYKYDWIWHKNKSGGFITAKKMPMKYHEIISVFYKQQPTYNPQFTKYSDSVYQRFTMDDINLVNADKTLERKDKNKIQNIKQVQTFVDLSRGKYPESVIKIKQEQTNLKTNNVNGRKRLHPTQKPVALIEYLIKTYTQENELVLDFTAGSFTTAIACMNTNRQFIGIELDEKYYNIGVDRVNKHKGLL